MPHHSSRLVWPRYAALFALSCGVGCSDAGPEGAAVTGTDVAQQQLSTPVEFRLGLPAGGS